MTLFIALILMQTVSAATISGNVFEWYSLQPLDKVIVEINTVPVQRTVSSNGSYSFEAPVGNYSIKAAHFENGEIAYVTDENISIEKEGNFKLDLILFPTLEEDELDEFLDLDINMDEIDENALIEIEAEKKKCADKKCIIESITPYILFAFIIAMLIIFASYYKKKKSKTVKEKEENKKGIEKTREERKTTGTEKIGKEKVENTMEIEKMEKEKTEEKIEKEKDEIISKTLSLDNDAMEVLEIIKKSGNRLTQRELRDKSPLSEAKVSLILTELESHGLIKKIKKGRGNIIVLKK